MSTIQTNVCLQVSTFYKTIYICKIIAFKKGFPGGVSFSDHERINLKSVSRALSLSYQLINIFFLSTSDFPWMSSFSLTHTIRIKAIKRAIINFLHVILIEDCNMFDNTVIGIVSKVSVFLLDFRFALTFFVKASSPGNI